MIRRHHPVSINSIERLIHDAALAKICFCNKALEAFCSDEDRIKAIKAV